MRVYLEILMVWLPMPSEKTKNKTSFYWTKKKTLDWIALKKYNKKFLKMLKAELSELWDTRTTCSRSVTSTLSFFDFSPTGKMS